MALAAMRSARCEARLVSHCSVPRGRASASAAVAVRSRYQMAWIGSLPRAATKNPKTLLGVPSRAAAARL